MSASARGKVCCISPLEARELELYETKPDCRDHDHISRREAREWLESEYGPERMVPTKFIHTGTTSPTTRRTRRRTASFVGKGGRYLMVEHLSSPQIGHSDGFKVIQWLGGMPKRGGCGPRLRAMVDAPSSLLPCQ